ncbi:MAG: RNA polymerase sigma factor [Actinomycetota bacterium]|nr:RNA polymerase sigma factor [Actinomycetota bacterium]
MFEVVLEGARRGDRDDLATLWRYYNPAMVRYLSIFVGSDCDDVASEAWISIARALKTFEGDEEAFRRFVIVIAKRKAVDFERGAIVRERRKDRFSIAYSRDLEIGERSDVVDDSADLLVLLKTYLPSEVAEIIFLRYILDFNVGEVAQIVNRSQEAVRTASHRGLLRLRERLLGKDLADIGL